MSAHLHAKRCAHVLPCAVGSVRISDNVSDSVSISDREWAVSVTMTVTALVTETVGSVSENDSGLSRVAHG